MHLEKSSLRDISGIFKVSNLSFDEAKNPRLIAMEERLKGSGGTFLTLGHKSFI